MMESNAPSPGDVPGKPLSRPEKVLKTADRILSALNDPDILNAVQGKTVADALVILNTKDESIDLDVSRGFFPNLPTETFDTQNLIRLLNRIRRPHQKMLGTTDPQTVAIQWPTVITSSAGNTQPTEEPIPTPPPTVTESSQIEPPPKQKPFWARVWPFGKRS